MRKRIPTAYDLNYQNGFDNGLRDAQNDIFLPTAATNHPYVNGYRDGQDKGAEKALEESK